MRRPRNPIAMLRGAYHSLGRIERELDQQRDKLDRTEREAREAPKWLERIEREVGELGEALGRVEREVEKLRDGARGLAMDERANRARLAALRREPDYELPWNEPRPLISVMMASIGRPQLTELALPSILGQSYGEIEVIVAVDGVGPELEERVRGLGDDRVRYLDLGPRVPVSDDPRKRWLVGPTLVRHAALRAARGRWLVSFDDDDEMRPECFELLLELARETRAEAVYGQVKVHRDEGAFEFVRFPPRHGYFTWAGGMYHAGLRLFEPEFLAGDLDLPGDWWLAERMLRAGVRFAMREEVLAEIYPSPGGSL